MTVAANGNHTVELKQTILELKKGLEEAVSQKASIETVTRMQTQLDALDVKLAERHVGATPSRSIADSLKENESVSRLLRDKKGRAVIEFDAGQARQILGRKNVITAVTSGSVNGDTLNPVGLSTTGVLQIDRIGGITAEARQVLKIRDVLSARPTTMQVVDFVKVVNPMSIASPVPEASVKPENQMTFQSVSERVKLLATWIPATRQVLDDFQELMGFIQSSLGFYVDLAEELGLLLGDGVNEDLHGIIPQAASFNTSLLPSAQSGWNKIDMIATAISQINTAKEIDPTFVILHPADWWNIRLTKDGFGRYLINPDPQASVSPNIFGLDVVTTTSMPLGTFLVGSGNPAAAEIRDRMGLQIEISSEHASFFTQNLLAVRAEKRLCLVLKRNLSFVVGSFVTSPVTSL